MPRTKRHKTGYKGVTYCVLFDGSKVFYLRYRRFGCAKVTEEKTAAKTASQASQFRARKIDGETSNAENRRAAQWTISTLWNEYLDEKGSYPSEYTETKLVELYLLPVVGDKRPNKITGKDLNKIRELAGTPRLKKKPDKKKKGRPSGDRTRTVDYSLRMLKRIVKFGVDNGKSPPLGCKLTLKAGKSKTEYLTSAQISKLLAEAMADENKISAGVVILALLTGLRKGELFNLQWSDIDFDRDFIKIRESKGAKLSGDEEEFIPLSKAVRNFLSNFPTYGSPYIFPGANGARRQNITRTWTRIRTAAKLPEDFRFHGLRHAYATAMAESKNIDIQELQKLLRHRSIDMTMKYSHIADKRLKKAADVATDVFGAALEKATKSAKSAGTAIIPIDQGKRRQG